MNNINDKNIKNVASKANINIDELKKATENGNIDDFIDKKLSPEASKKIKQILSDKSATDKLLQTPQAKELLNKLMNK